MSDDVEASLSDALESEEIPLVEVQLMIGQINVVIRDMRPDASLGEVSAKAKELMGYQIQEAYAKKDMFLMFPSPPAEVYG